MESYSNCAIQETYCTYMYRVLIDTSRLNFNEYRLDFYEYGYVFDRFRVVITSSIFLIWFAFIFCDSFLDEGVHFDYNCDNFYYANNEFVLRQVSSRRCLSFFSRESFVGVRFDSGPKGLQTSFSVLFALSYNQVKTFRVSDNKLRYLCYAFKDSSRIRTLFTTAQRRNWAGYGRGGFAFRAFFVFGFW